MNISTLVGFSFFLKEFLLSCQTSRYQTIPLLVYKPQIYLNTQYFEVNSVLRRQNYYLPKLTLENFDSILILDTIRLVQQLSSWLRG